MSARRHPGFVTSATPPPAPFSSLSRVGQVKRPDRPWSSDPTNGRHARCIEHVPVDGLREPICIGRGQDRDRAIADARELAGG